MVTEGFASSDGGVQGAGAAAAVLGGVPLGLGHDVVDVVAFGVQLGEPGSRVASLFSGRERRQAGVRARVGNDGVGVHLAAKWAGKEAVLKAWCEALGGRPSPYTLDDFPWSEVEILDDSRGRPHVVLGPVCDAAFLRSLAGSGGSSESLGAEGGNAGAGTAAYVWHISLSHDGPIASAVAMCMRSRG